MPVSHIGLTVENLPAATSFFLAALQPLGYRYIGTRDNQIGLGVDDADFFLSLADETKPAPVHVAFRAASTIAVRDFYTAALTAGASATGRPSYRGKNGDIFNAAVLDLDGNTVEVVCRPQDHVDPTHSIEEQNETNPVKTGSHVHSAASESKTALPFREAPRTPSTRGISHALEATSEHVSQASSSSTIHNNASGSRSFAGTLLGAAAGAAAIYTFFSMERDSAREEAEYRGRVARRYSSSKEHSFPAERLADSERHYFTPPSQDDRAVVPTSTRNRQILQHEVLQPETANFPNLRRTHASNISGEQVQRHRPAPARRITYHGLIDTITELSDDEERQPRRDSAISITSYRSDRSGGGRHARVLQREPSRHISDAARRQLGWDPPSHGEVSRFDRRHSTPASPRQPAPKMRERDRKRRGSQSSAAEVPLPQSRAPSYMSAKDVALPESIVDSRASFRNKDLYRRRDSNATAKSRTRRATLEIISKTFGDVDRKGEKDNIDAATVVPDDSISCAGFPHSHCSRESRKGDKHRRSGHSGRRSETDSESTVKPYRKERSLLSLPVRTRESRDRDHHREDRRSLA